MTTDRSRTWASTMAGYRTAGPDASAAPAVVGGGEVLPHPHGTTASGPGIRRAHAGSSFRVGPLGRGWSRLDKEAFEAEHLVAGATRSHGAGRRLVDEEPDPTRTCFERDRDRILHSSAFRRLAGKTQVFVFPDDHQRTRLTHAIEVAQVATSLASALHLNVALTEAIALGHDCGHGPGGHASEDALDPYVDEGYDHAVWGADVVLTPLNLCQETLDGIRNHSWSRPTPSTPEAEIVAWADRIAYVCHDFEDAVSAGLVTPDRLPEAVRRRCGSTRRLQLASFIEAVVEATISTGEIGMHDDVADALAAFRLFNYEHIYLRPSSVEQGNRVVRLLRALVEHYAAHPGLLPPSRLRDIDASSPEAFREAVTYVGGMTDRFACTQAVALVGYPVNDLPTGFDLPTR